MKGMRRISDWKRSTFIDIGSVHCINCPWYIDEGSIMQVREWLPNK